MDHADTSRPRPLRADAADNQRAILNAAARLWAEDPDAPVAAVADAAGVSRVTVYRRFPTREGLLDALREQAARESADAIAGIDPLHGPPLQALERIVGALAEIAHRYQVVYLPGITSTPAASDRDIRAGLTELVTRAQTVGEVRTDIPAGWVVTVISAHLAAAARAQHRGDTEPAATGGLLTATLLHGIAAGSDSPPRPRPADHATAGRSARCTCHGAG
ncbi:TetR/AcrR family transcriptional regulator [Streptacidiphilus sp. ASG 303]|uniref:TetR/AcrR family transcriptional regulator n=1 Tax=Streptacidiphilus sp. ASG 303 TaxID=2896847 RepID=UPI001E30FAF4|nr:TetR/AcrR family transcriptional regulator [Streptacidiphilus sp. ASG 303]MCD0486066.1 TetR/AcrR family transcriptional regulator [Streptacidiphilus sp. ASG 303]